VDNGQENYNESEAYIHYCRKWLKAEIGSGDFADFGLGLESVKYIVVQVAENGFGLESVMRNGGKIKRGLAPPFFRFYGLEKLIGSDVCWFVWRDIIDRHL
jgi:hypothetical protein